MSSPPPGTFSYIMDLSQTPDYGIVTLGDEAAPYMEDRSELIEHPVFRGIIQKCKYYKDLIYDHESDFVPGDEPGQGAGRLDRAAREALADRIAVLEERYNNLTITDDEHIELVELERDIRRLWFYGGDNWNGTEYPNNAPTCHLIKPFFFSVENIEVDVFTPPPVLPLFREYCELEILSSTLESGFGNVQSIWKTTLPRPVAACILHCDLAPEDYVPSLWTVSWGDGCGCDDPNHMHGQDPVSIAGLATGIRHTYSASGDFQFKIAEIANPINTITRTLAIRDSRNIVVRLIRCISCPPGCPECYQCVDGRCVGIFCEEDEYCEDGACMKIPREEFKFVIDTRQTNTGLDGSERTFNIPVSVLAHYNWEIEWGDGATETQSGFGNPEHTGIPHVYQSAGQYTITIKSAPTAMPNAWLRAFGFADRNTGANNRQNKWKVVSPLSPLTPAMFLEIYPASDSTNLVAPDDVGMGMFAGCHGYGFHFGEDFRFSPEWDEIYEVGTNFGHSMFKGCSTLKGLANFNLPQIIEEEDDEEEEENVLLPPVTDRPRLVGRGYACEMFDGCSALVSLPEKFNFPPDIHEVVGHDFGRNMFRGCSALAGLPEDFNISPNIKTTGANFLDGIFANCFNLKDIPENFNFPQGITVVGAWFGLRMFFNCFQIQIPVGFKFPLLSQAELNKTGVFTSVFECDEDMEYPVQEAEATSIINGNPTPNNRRRTFWIAGGQGAARWPDYSYIHEAWR
jgi:hypothetical protein